MSLLVADVDVEAAGAVQCRGLRAHACTDVLASEGSSARQRRGMDLCRLQPCRLRRTSRHYGTCINIYRTTPTAYET